MPKNNSSSLSRNIKLIITFGYLILISLGIYGVVRIYKELVIFSEYDRPFEERKELALISNTLASLYEAESMNKVIYSEAYTENVKNGYNKLIKKVYFQIDSLYNFSKNPALHSHLDTVKILLEQKEKNQESIFTLLDSIRRLPLDKRIHTTVLSQKDLSKLDMMFKSHLERNKDTTVIKTTKKNFFDRLKNVFKSGEDSAIFVSSAEKYKTDSTYVDPAVLLRDTIAQYVNNIIYKDNKRKSILISQLALRQHEMFQNNEQITLQINQILRDLETKELKIIYNLMEEKEHTMSRSFWIVMQIALASLITAIIFLILSLRSVSISQKYRKQIEEGKKHVEELLKSREKLLLMISHDIKAPLSSIIGYIELLGNSKLSEKEKGYLQNMQSSSEHVLELINKLLDYHRLEQGKKELNKMSFSPYRLMDDISQSFLPLAAKKGLSFEFINDLPQGTFNESDPFVIRQIVSNLISNAIKFTSTGKIALKAHLEKDTLQILVEDTGVGISKEDRENLFEEFKRLKHSEKNQIEGAGLGLAITQKLVLLLEGCIDFESELGKGTKFMLSIPLKPCTYVPEEKGIETTPNKRTSAKILFVDDDLVILNVYMKLLQREGHDVSICENPMEVLLLLQQKHFDIIFTDIQMPGMNGFELVERIRVFDSPEIKTIPVIALSARSDISEEKFKEAGFSGFLAKPFSSKLLLDIIDKFVQNNNVEPRLNEKNNYQGIHSLVEFVENDKEASLEILNVFVSENENTIKGIQTALDNKDWESIRKYAHKLLPLMRIIGADQIVSILLELENGLQDTSKVENAILMIKQKNLETVEFMNSI